VATHYDSLRATASLTAGPILTIVDDVVTRGATMLAGAARLSDAFPAATVRCFALIRAMSSAPIQRVKEPCEGTITLVDWGTQRAP
jgi:adenine/guanine phosphoribosyltransferase-like PRPP-binding protein